MEPTVSLIICTYERSKVLRDTLEQVTALAVAPLETIVVDQTGVHPPDMQAYLAAGHAAGDFCYYHIERPNLPNARNFGVRHARGDVVLFIDDDVVLDPDIITQHINAYDDPTVGGVAGRRTFPYPNGDDDNGAIGAVNEKGGIVTNFSAETPIDSVDWASGCHMSFRRSLIIEVGGFSVHHIGTAVYEDVDFCLRLKAHGYRIRFYPKAHLVHLREVNGGAGTRRYNKYYFYTSAHNRALFFLKHFPIYRLPLLYARHWYAELREVVETRRFSHIGLLVVAYLQAHLLSQWQYQLAHRRFSKTLHNPTQPA